MNKDNVTALPGTIAETKQSIVGVLEGLLQRAQEGELEGISVCAYGSVGILRQHVIGEEIFVLIGALEAEKCYLATSTLVEQPTYG